jgi:dihydroorotate dehydrogenase
LVNYLVKPWLLLPSETAHEIGKKALKIYSGLCSQKTPEWHPLHWRGLHFKNPFGISGGVDKDCEYISDWWRLGVGFLEVGTVTPLPQPGNAGKVIDRNNSQRAVWNRMGFPSKGLEYSLKKLRTLPIERPTPVFANVGKNAATPLEKASLDYIECIQRLHPFVDAFVINISSPNTQGLRELLREDKLKAFLEPLFGTIVKTSKPSMPLLLKLSPDMDEAALKAALDISFEAGIAGWILTNTSVSLREGLTFPPEGGVSGLPLQAQSRQCLKWAVEHLGERKKDRLLISSGGIMSAEEALLRLEMGADLIQAYSALIFEGPMFFCRLADRMKGLSPPPESASWL